MPDRCEHRSAVAGARQVGSDSAWLLWGVEPYRTLRRARDQTLAAGNQRSPGFPALPSVGGGRMGGGHRLLAGAQLPGARWSVSRRRKRSGGRRRGLAVGVLSERLRQEPGMAQDTLPRPYSSVLSVLPGLRTGAQCHLEATFSAARRPPRSAERVRAYKSEESAVGVGRRGADG